ncbi:MAG: YggT family protein [Anaerosomatales bacterium]|nr:YggT family protein [Anaerosomatales bacterium]MDT8434379.1 YggT family protein [Anaerosomatales bacterium]
MTPSEQSNERVVVHKTRSSGNRAITGIISWISGAIEVILAFRFGLLLFGANPEAAFVDFIYRIAAPFMVPFEAVFGVTETRMGSIFDWSTLLAILVYAVVAWGLTSLIRNVGYSSSTTVEQVEKAEREHIE